MIDNIIKKSFIIKQSEEAREKDDNIKQPSNESENDFMDNCYDTIYSNFCLSIDIYSSAN